MRGKVDTSQYDLYKEVEAEINVGLKVRVRNENGNIVHEDDGHCYTRAFLRMIYMLMSKSDNLTLTSANSDSEPNDTEPYIPKHQENVLNDFWQLLSTRGGGWKTGILLSTWESTDDNALTKVTPYHLWKPIYSSYHRSGVINRYADGGPLEYKETQYSDINNDITNGAWKIVVSRQVINQSSDDVIVKAMSLNTSTDGSPYDSSTNTRQMIMRDILTSYQTISSGGGSLNFEYEVRIEDSNGDGTGVWTLLRGMILHIHQHFTDNNRSDHNFGFDGMDWWSKNNLGTHGMVFSTDNNPVSPTVTTPSDMVSPIPEGDKAGELKYYPTRVLVPSDGEPNGDEFVENVFKLKGLDGDIDSTANEYTDSDISDFTAEDITTSDLLYVRSTQRYYTISSISSSAITLGETPPGDLTGVTVDIIDNTDPRTEIVISGVAENKSGGQIDAYKVYLNDDNEDNPSATIGADHFDSAFTFDPGALGRCDFRIILKPE